MQSDTITSWVKIMIVVICLLGVTGCQPVDVAPRPISITDTQTYQTEVMPSPSVISTYTPAPTATPPLSLEVTKEVKLTASLKAADCITAGLPAIACSGAAENKVWAPFIREFNGIPMVLVPAGCFTMGSTDEQIEYYMTLLDRRGVYENEQPAHQQCFSEPFWIDMYEITNGYYGSYGWEQENDQPGLFEGPEGKSSS